MYYFYMGSVLLPISPENFSLKVNNANKTLTLINEGEINILRTAGLTDLEFKVIIPVTKYAFAMYEGGIFKSPAYYINHFETLKTSKKPFQFIVSRQMPDGKLLFDTNITVSMEDYTIDEKSKEGFDLVVSISLKQYKYFGTKVVKVVDDPTTGEETAVVEEEREQTNSPTPTQEVAYTIKAGDTLWNIAKEVYGDGKYYRLIAEENVGKYEDSTHLQPGKIFIIPPLTESAKMRFNLTVSGGGGNQISYKEDRGEGFNAR